MRLSCTQLGHGQLRVWQPELGGLLHPLARLARVRRRRQRAAEVVLAQRLQDRRVGALLRRSVSSRGAVVAYDAATGVALVLFIHRAQAVHLFVLAALH